MGPQLNSLPRTAGTPEAAPRRSRPPTSRRCQPTGRRRSSTRCLRSRSRRPQRRGRPRCRKASCQPVRRIPHRPQGAHSIEHRCGIRLHQPRIPVWPAHEPPLTRAARRASLILARDRAGLAPGRGVARIDGLVVAESASIGYVRSSTKSPSPPVGVRASCSSQTRGFESTTSYFRASSGFVIGCQPLTPSYRTSRC